MLNRNRNQAAIVDPDTNFLQHVKFFLEPLNDGSLPAYQIQREIFDALLRLPIEKDTLMSSGIGKVVLFYTKSKRPELNIKRMAERLLGEWSRPILKRTDDYRKRHVETRDFDYQYVWILFRGGFFFFFHLSLWFPSPSGPPPPPGTLLLTEMFSQGSKASPGSRQQQPADADATAGAERPRRRARADPRPAHPEQPRPRHGPADFVHHRAAQQLRSVANARVPTYWVQRPRLVQEDRQQDFQEGLGGGGRRWRTGACDNAPLLCTTTL